MAASLLPHSCEFGPGMLPDRLVALWLADQSRRHGMPQIRARKHHTSGCTHLGLCRLSRMLCCLSPAPVTQPKARPVELSNPGVPSRPQKKKNTCCCSQTKVRTPGHTGGAGDEAPLEGVQVLAGGFALQRACQLRGPLHHQGTVNIGQLPRRNVCERERSQAPETAGGCQAWCTWAQRHHNATATTSSRAGPKL